MGWSKRKRKRKKRKKKKRCLTQKKKRRTQYGEGWDSKKVTRKLFQQGGCTLFATNVFQKEKQQDKGQIFLWEAKMRKENNKTERKKSNLWIDPSSRKRVSAPGGGFCFPPAPEL